MKRAFILILLLSMIACTSQNPSGPYEITETDLFSMPNYHSLNVTVLTIRLGDTEERVLTQLGKPDNINTYQDQDMTITNFEYKTLLETDKIGLVVHLENNVVERITFKEPFNKYLKGKTKIVPEYTKEELFNLFGEPTSKTIMDPFTVYHYEDRGLEILFNEKGWNGFTLVRPKEVTINDFTAISLPVQKKK